MGIQETQIRTKIRKRSEGIFIHKEKGASHGLRIESQILKLIVCGGSGWGRLLKLLATFFFING
jgi:hypothetical protein